MNSYVIACTVVDFGIIMNFYKIFRILHTYTHTRIQIILALNRICTNTKLATKLAL